MTSITKSSIANSSGQSNRSSRNGSNSILSPHSSTGTNGIASSSSSRQGDNRKGTHQSCFSLTLLASIKSETSMSKTSVTKTSIAKASMAKTSIAYSCRKSSRNDRGYSNRGSCNSSNRSLATKSSTCTRSIASGGKLRDGYNWKCVSSIMSKKEASISFSLLATIEAKTGMSKTSITKTSIANSWMSYSCNNRSSLDSGSRGCRRSGNNC